MKYNSFKCCSNNIALEIPKELIEEVSNSLIVEDNNNKGKRIDLKKLADFNNSEVDTVTFDMYAASPLAVTENNIPKDTKVKVIISILSLSNGIYEEIFINDNCLMVIDANHVLGYMVK